MTEALPLHSLTSLRFFAALSIVALHTLTPILGLNTDGRLGLGVGFFFVLSGFILTYVYRNFTNHSRAAFYISRFARLWPIHIVTFVLAILTSQPSSLLQPIYAMTALLNALLVQAWLPINGLVFSWNAPSWSISAEVWFYLLFPFLASTNRLWIWIVALTAIAAGIVLTVPVTSPTLFSWSFIHAIQQHPAVRVLEFAAGVIAGRLFNSGFRLRGGTILEIAAVAVVGLYAATSIDVQNAITTAVSRTAGIWYSQSGGMFAFAFAIFVFAQGAGAISRLLSWWGFVRLGEISFATYMLHYILVVYAIRHHWVDTLGRPLTATILFTAIYGGSYVLWLYVEKPARKKIIDTAT